MRIYGELSHREHAGWLLGLTPAQAVLCLVLLVPVVITLSSGRLKDTLIAAAICVPLVLLVAVPVRGRPAFRWLAHFMMHQVGAAAGWSSWQSRVAAGFATDPEEPDLPGALQRLRFPEGPPFRDQGRVCLIHDTGEGRWAVTARLTHAGVGLLSDEQCERLATRLGGLLISLGHRGTVDRMSLLVRTAPDERAEYETWRLRHEMPDAPVLAQQASEDLRRAISSAAICHQVYLTISGSEDALRRPAVAAGGGVDGRAAVLHRVMDGLEERLRALGVLTVRWLSGAELAAAIRTGFNPAAAHSLALPHRTDPEDPELPWALAGPGVAPTPPIRSYQHDGFTSVSYTVLMPEAGVAFGSLGSFLAVKTAGERRSLAIHYEVLSPSRARSLVRRDRFRTGVLRDVKTRKGFSSAAGEQREARTAQAQEQAVAAGHAIVRYALAAAVTVPADWAIEDHAAGLENDVAGRFRLLRLELAQDSGFVAAALPLGLGLPRWRGRLA